MSLGLDSTSSAGAFPGLSNPAGQAAGGAAEDGSFQVASAGAIPFPAQAGAGALRLVLPELATGAAGAASAAGVVAGVGILAAPLAGDTPQPTKHSFDGLNLYVSADHKQAWFTRDAGAALSLGLVQVLPHEEALNVPTHVTGGAVTFDSAALEKAYGGQLPSELTAQARPEVSERTSPTGSPALSTSSKAARAVAQNSQQLQNWQAHHLIPFSVANEPAFAPSLMKAAQTGWKLDSPKNVIALPADRKSYLGPPNNQMLPEHNGSHSKYSGRVRSELTAALGALPANATPAQTKAAVEGVEQKMQALIAARIYNPKIF